MERYKNFLLIEVPDYGIDHWIINNGGEKVGINWYDPKRTFGDEGLMWSEGKRLTPGNYTIVGKGNELTEDDWLQIVKCIRIDGSLICTDYENEKGFTRTRKESGYSLLKSKNLEPNKTLIVQVN